MSILLSSDEEFALSPEALIHASLDQTQHTRTGDDGISSDVTSRFPPKVLTACRSIRNLEPWERFAALHGN